MSITDETKTAMRSWFMAGYLAGRDSSGVIRGVADLLERDWQRAWADYVAWASKSKA